MEDSDEDLDNDILDFCRDEDVNQEAILTKIQSLTPDKIATLLRQVFQAGEDDGHSIGFSRGFDRGDDLGYVAGRRHGYSNGYSFGFRDGLASQEYED